MVDHNKIGRVTILEAAESQLKRIEEADNVSLIGSGIFEIALRRIGENELASKFSDTDVESIPYIVRRPHSYDEILTSIISRIERGDINQARRIEDSQRRMFYIDGVGYLDPHFRDLGPTDWRRIKRKARESKGNLKSLKFLDDSPKAADKSQYLYNLRIYPKETVYAIFSNLALGRNRHAKK
jgi:hypothetical protein